MFARLMATTMMAGLLTACMPEGLPLEEGIDGPPPSQPGAPTPADPPADPESGEGDGDGEDENANEDEGEGGEEEGDENENDPTDETPSEEESESDPEPEQGQAPAPSPNDEEDNTPDPESDEPSQDNEPADPDEEEPADGEPTDKDENEEPAEPEEEPYKDHEQDHTPQPLTFPEEPTNAKMSREDAARFLIQATFGATPESIVELQELGYEQWLVQQFEMPEGMHVVDRYRAHLVAGGQPDSKAITSQFWENAIRGDDQLRWRSTLALSQIVVVSLADTQFWAFNESLGNYLELLKNSSLGNYCSLVRDVSLRPVMGLYLSSFNNRKADPETGFAPDENYAREVMQLFTIGLDELNMDGTPTGQPTYDNTDIQELAKIFTGFSIPRTDGSTELTPRHWVNDTNAWEMMVGYPDYHEPGAKEFLGTRIDLGAQPQASFDAAMDYLLSHPNVAPFIAKQMIQKFVLSNPSPEYIRRVAEAFQVGRYRMPSGTYVGDGRRCDMKATLSAVLLDDEARDRNRANDPEYGKVRSPLLRFAQIYRVFGNVEGVSENGKVKEIHHLGNYNDIYNMPFMRAESVFNFYRPGFSPPGSELADRGLLAPEMALMTTSQVINITDIVRTEMTAGSNVNNLTAYDPPRYLEMSRDIDALVDELDVLLTYGSLEPDGSDHIRSTLKEIGKFETPEGLSDTQLGQRLQYAAALFMTSPEYIVQR